MSIWCSRWPVIGEDDDEHPDRTVLAYREGWSNHYPDPDTDEPAAVDTAHIPPWCVPGHDTAEDETDAYGEWLRLSISMRETHGCADCRSVYMHEAAVRKLRDDLDAWLNHPKARPQ